MAPAERRRAVIGCYDFPTSTANALRSIYQTDLSPKGAAMPVADGAYELIARYVTLATRKSSAKGRERKEAIHDGMA